MRSELREAAALVHAYFKERESTLAVAESCTGGLVSHCLTEIPGASLFFIAGLVTYADAAKQMVLGIAPDLIARYGAVSGEAAREMAERVRRLLGADFGLSTTGNLGPEALEGKERGLVYLAVSSGSGTFSKTLHLAGDRTENKEAAALEALRFLLESASPPRAD